MLPVKEINANTLFCAFVPRCPKVEHTFVTLMSDDRVDFYSIVRTVVYPRERHCR